MTVVIAGAILWVVAAGMMIAAASHSRDLLTEGLKDGAIDVVKLIPRVAIGVVGSGYVAALLPPEVLGDWLGPNSGLIGTAIATAAGALTPGGPVVGFSIGVAALKSGAGAPQVIAYTTAWALFALQRVASYEAAVMPPRIVWLRVVVSIPVPFLAALGATLIGKP